METMRAEIVHVTVERTATDVYDFASRPEKMPLWASGLAEGLEEHGDHWVATGPLGAVRIVFAAPNPFGVIDHTVTLPSGIQAYNALRVTPNGTGALVTFTVLHLPGTDEAGFARDVEWVRDDLFRLKALLESPATD